jgi:Ca2+-binding RTX toxin-like protein
MPSSIASRRRWRSLICVVVVSIATTGGVLAAPAVGAVPVCNGDVRGYQVQPGVEFHGTIQADVILGTPGRDVIYGGRGSDKICGLGGDDVIFGEDDNDSILDGPGNDYVYGGPGDDFVNWNFVDGAGDDNLDGGAGVDKIRGGGGYDHIHGGPDNDVLADAEVQHGGSGNDGLCAGVIDPSCTESLSPVVLYGEGGNDGMEGGSGPDVLRGGDGGDVMYGFGGDDTIIADGTGSDYLLGGNGDDHLIVQAEATGEWKRLIGGNGNDTLVGGPDHDALDCGFGVDSADGQGSSQDVLFSWSYEPPMCETKKNIP